MGMYTTRCYHLQKKSPIACLSIHPDPKLYHSLGVSCRHTLRYVMNKKNVPLLIFFCFIFLMFQVPFNPNSAHDIWTAIRGNGKSVLLLDAFEKNVSFKRMKSH